MESNLSSSSSFSFLIVSFVFFSRILQCDTGIALLAYMDGIQGSPTLCGVVLATISGAAYAVFKVCETCVLIFCLEYNSIDICWFSNSSA